MLRPPGGDLPELQPLVGALLGVDYLGEVLTIFTVVGGALILAGLSLTLKGQGTG